MASASRLITDLLGIRTPVISAPMAGPSGGTLAAQVTIGGGFGFIAAGYEDASAFRKQLEAARSILEASPPRPQLSSAGSVESVRVGAGFLGWLLDETTKGKADGNVELIDVALDAQVQAVWFSFGADIGKYVRYVRTQESKRNAMRNGPHKTLVFVQVNSVEEARTAVLEWDVDVLVVQGIESGGHGQGNAPPLLALLSEVLDMLRHSPKISAVQEKSMPPVLAAGGLTTGTHVAAMLTLGAAGVVFGTRFLLSPEARYTSSQKNALLQATSASTLRTTAFDALRGTTGWPAGIDGRALRNDVTSRLSAGETVEDVKADFDQATREGDAKGMLVWSGTGIGSVKEVKPAAEIVKEVHDELVSCLHQAAALGVKSRL